MFLLRSPLFRSSSSVFRRLRRNCSTSGESKNQSSAVPEIERLPGSSNRVELVESEKDWDLVYPALVSSLERFPALGFDCEWPPTPNPSFDDSSTEDKENFWYRRKLTKVALLQLATRDGTAVLVRIGRMDSIPDTLRGLLADRSFLKVGVEANMDSRHLRTDYPNFFEHIFGTLDVRYLIYPNPEARYGRGKIHRMQTSLDSLSQNYLNSNRQKDKAVACSDWATPILAPEQIEYAAADAQLSIDVFIALLQYLGFNVEAEDWKDIYEHCRPYLDQTFRPRSSKPPRFYPTPGVATSQHRTPADSRAQERSTTGTASTDNNTICDKR